MIFRKFQLALVATALGGAMGVASAQGVSPGTDASALTREAEASTNTTAGSPGTQSGAAPADTSVAAGPDTASMGAPPSSPIYSGPSLSRTQERLLQRHNALR